MTVSSRIFLVALLLAAGLVARPAAAAESYDNCTGFIDSLPAAISTQGVWCLRKNLSTNITSGSAIEITANNVTIDCNDFKIGGLAAGNSSEAMGIVAQDRQNATVRQCNVRGFYYGIHLNSGAGYLVEDNRLDNNLYTGIDVSGDNGRVLRNAVYDTGGASGLGYATGIRASANIIDNTVSGLFADISPGTLSGIRAQGHGAQVHGNHVSGLGQTATDGGAVGRIGIWLESAYQRASGNQVISGTSLTPSGIGIFATDDSSFCLDNTAGGFGTNIHGSCTGNGNETRL